MNLVTLLSRKNIEGLSEGELVSILNKNSHIKIKSARNGLIVLDNNKIIKCVREYYKDPKGKPLSKSGDPVSKCFYTQQEFGLSNDVSIGDCESCHLACLNKKNKGKLVRIYK